MLYILLIFFVINVLFMITQLISSKRLQAQAKHLEKEQHELDAHLQMMKENKELLSHIQTEYNKQKADLMRLTASDCDKKSASDTGSLILDSIIDDIRKQCLCKSIHFTVLCEHFSSPFSKIDMISLFYNILDNAVEACLFLTKDRFITLHVFSENNNICIMCENSKSEKSAPVANNFRTIKADKINHGKGVAVIRDIVEKYGGNVTYTDMSSVLKLSITVPVNPSNSKQ